MVYTGHSLGGRLAAEASIVSGNPAVLFNAAGVSPSTVQYLAETQGINEEQLRTKLAGGQVRTYTTADDPLTNLQKNIPLMPKPVGTQIPLGGNNLNPADGHLMPNVTQQMKTRFPGYFYDE